MRRPSLFSRNEQMDSTMTPMIDVVFLLLVFFVWTASFQVIEYLLPSELSSQLGASANQVSEPVPADDFEKLIVRITWRDGAPRYEMKLYQDQPGREFDSLAGAMDYLTTISKIKNDAPMIVHPDPTVPLGPVIEIYDAAKNVGFEKISFAARRK